MSLITLAIIFWVIFLISMFYEPRNFLNALLLIFNLGLTVLAVAAQPGIQGMILGLFIMMIPLFLLLIAIFLILNGIQMYKKEGHRLQNLLSLFLGIAMIVGGIGTVIGLNYFQASTVLASIFYLVVLLEFYVSVCLQGNSR